MFFFLRNLSEKKRILHIIYFSPSAGRWLSLFFCERLLLPHAEKEDGSGGCCQGNGDKTKRRNVFFSFCLSKENNVYKLLLKKKGRKRGINNVNIWRSRRKHMLYTYRQKERLEKQKAKILFIVSETYGKEIKRRRKYCYFLTCDKQACYKHQPVPKESSYNIKV